MPFGRRCGSFRTTEYHSAMLSFHLAKLVQELVVHESEHRAAPASFKMELISALRPSRRVAEAGLREVLGVIGPRTQSESTFSSECFAADVSDIVVIVGLPGKSKDRS